MTPAERIAQTRQRLGLYLQAEAAILGGAQSYSIGNRTLSRADLQTIRDEIRKLTMESMKAETGGAIRIQRIVPRDNY